MPDRVLFPLMGLAAVLMIALALVWPQGLGARSPGPFGHAPVQQQPRPAPAGPQSSGPAILGLTPSAPAPAGKPAS